MTSLIFELAAFLFPIFAEATATTHFPFEIPSACSINVVTSQNSSQPSIDYEHAYPAVALFTHFATPELDLAFEPSPDGGLSLLASLIPTHSRLEVDTREKYLHFQRKFGDNTCLIFFLFTKDLEETAGAIHNSGFGTSDHASFFVRVETVSEENQLISQFAVNSLFQTGWDAPALVPFHAHLLFFSDTGVGIHCYFCPSGSHLHVSLLEGASFARLLSASRSLNNGGFGRHLAPKLPPVDVDAESFKFHGTESRQSFYRKAAACIPVHMTYVSLLTASLNVTMVSSFREVPPEEQISTGWFLQMSLGESAFFHVPNNHLASRDRYALTTEQPTDLIALPYLQAFLLETDRYCSMAPIVTPHCLTKDVEYKGYQIPQGTIIFLNTWGIHRSKEHWGDPENFRPDRFIDENGKVITNDEWFLPFGSGKRRCPGEILARTTVFLYTANLLQRYNFSVIPGTPKPSDIPVIGLNLSAQPFSALVQRRE